MIPKECIIDVLRRHFVHYNDIILGRVADEIISSLEDDFIIRDRPTMCCSDCIHNGDLAVYTPNPAVIHLCQRGHQKGPYVAETCADYFSMRGK